MRTRLFKLCGSSLRIKATTLICACRKVFERHWANANGQNAITRVASCSALWKMKCSYFSRMLLSSLNAIPLVCCMDFSCSWICCFFQGLVILLGELPWDTIIRKPSADFMKQIWNVNSWVLIYCWFGTERQILRWRCDSAVTAIHPLGKWCPLHVGSAGWSASNVLQVQHDASGVSTKGLFLALCKSFATVM